MVGVGFGTVTLMSPVPAVAELQQQFVDRIPKRRINREPEALERLPVGPPLPRSRQGCLSGRRPMLASPLFRCQRSPDWRTMASFKVNSLFAWILIAAENLDNVDA